MGDPLLSRAQVAHALRVRDVDALRKLHPDNPRLQQFTREDRVVVSEPPGDLPGAWLAIPESTAMIIQPGDDEQRPFEPRWP